MEEIEYLTRLGLSEKEAKIYLTLIGEDSLSLLELSRKTGIHRPALYTLLPRLEAKELVQKRKVGKREQYSAESPKKIEKLFKKVESGLHLFVDRLNNEYESRGRKPTAQYYFGKNGYNYLFDDIAASVPKNGIYYRYSARRVDEKFFTPTDYYLKTRENKRFERRVITSTAKTKGKSNRLEREIKAIPSNVDLFDDNVSSYIYADKVAFVDFDTQTVFILTSKKIADFQRKLFEMLWKRL